MEGGDVHSDVLSIFIGKSSGQPCSEGQRSDLSIARALNTDGVNIRCSPAYNTLHFNCFSSDGH